MLESTDLRTGLQFKPHASHNLESKITNELDFLSCCINEKCIRDHCTTPKQTSNPAMLRIFSKKKVGAMDVHKFPLLCYQTSLQHGDDLATLTAPVILVATCVNINPGRITNHSVVENRN